MRRVLAAAVAAVAVAVTAGCASEAPPPVSQKVLDYYESKSAPTNAAPKRVAVIGDSYAAGVGAVDLSNGWVSRLGVNQAWDITNLARGGTGYFTAVTKGAKQACGLDYCPSYPEMIGEVAKAAPELVLVAGGRNDAPVDPVSESDAIRKFYTDLRAKLPKAKIVAFNALWDDSKPPAAINEISTEVKVAVQSVGGTYVTIDQPLGSHPGFVAPDGIHPNPAGHGAIFEATVTALQDAKLAVR